MLKMRLNRSAGEVGPTVVRPVPFHCCVPVSTQTESSMATIEKSNVRIRIIGRAVDCEKILRVALVGQKYVIVRGRNVMKHPAHLSYRTEESNGHSLTLKCFDDYENESLTANQTRFPSRHPFNFTRYVSDITLRGISESSRMKLCREPLR
jgi:hypothetical protein